MMNDTSWLLVSILSLSVLASAETLVVVSPEDHVLPPCDAKAPPCHMKLRAGVLHAPPLAVVDDTSSDGSVKFSGFQLDLLERLKEFARQDKVTLEFELSASPAHYGNALDLVAVDCADKLGMNHTACSQYDLMVGDYYGDPDRSMRVDFTPSWLRTSTSIVRFHESIDGKDSVPSHLRRMDLSRLSQADSLGATVCVPDFTYLMHVVMTKFPNARYYKCMSLDDCIRALEDQECVLYADDELLLRHRAAQDPRLEVIAEEQINTKYLVWPMRRDMPEVISDYMKRWMYVAVDSAALDELYSKYFQREPCPLGTAGENCELPCNPQHGRANLDGICVCDSQKWTGDDCSLEVEEDTNLIPDSFKAAAYSMTGFNLLLIVMCGGWLFWKKDIPQVQLSQPFFLGLMLLGCSISSASIIAMGQDDAGSGSVHTCMTIPWLYSVGFSITYGSLLAKMRRIYNIFQYSLSEARNGVVATRFNPKYANGTVVFRGFSKTAIVILSILAVDCMILMWWTAMSPMEWERIVTTTDMYGEPLESHGTCTSEKSILFASLVFAFHVVLMCYGCYLCYVSRNIPSRFQEGKAVSWALFSNLHILLLGLPMFFFTEGSPKSTFFLGALLVWFSDLVVLGTIFGRLIYLVHFRVDPDYQEAVKASIGEAVERYAAMHRRKGVQSTLKGSMESSSCDTPPTATNQQKKSTANSWFERDQGNHHPREIVLGDGTASRFDEPKRHDEGAEMSPHFKPLPRNMFSSSVSTELHANLASKIMYNADPSGHPLASPESSMMSLASSVPFSCSSTPTEASQNFRSSDTSSASQANLNLNAVTDVPTEDGPSSWRIDGPVENGVGNPKKPPKTTYSIHHFPGPTSCVPSGGNPAKVVPPRVIHERIKERERRGKANLKDMADHQRPRLAGIEEDEC